jgi:hypothetical protein
MSQIPEGPTSSYSDPFYDRLEALSNTLKAHRWLVLGVVVAAVVLALGVRSWLTAHPEAGSAATFLKAQERSQEARDDRSKAAAAWQTALDDATTTPYFKARAAIELAQVHLAGGEAAAAREALTKAAGFAKQVNDQELTATIALSRAAAEFQGGDLDAALAAYAEGERAAGARLPAQQIEAVMGQARTLERQGKADEALARLEPLTTRSDAGAEPLLALAKARYWRIKRLQAEAAAGPATAAAVAATAAVVVPAATAAPTATAATPKP